MLYTISTEDKSKRLDKFLVEKLTDLSRSQIQKIIKDGGVLVNGKKVSVHRFLKERDVVFLCHSRESGNPENNLKLDNAGFRIKSGMTINRYSNASQVPEIIFEDDNIIVINKPAGLLTHARSEELLHQEPTLVDWLLKHYPAIKTVGDKPELRPGIVHRLDKEASGVMAVAKNQETYEHLKKQFHDHEIKKEYLALVYGKLETDYGKIELPVGRAEKGGRMAARAQGQPGKEALTEFEVLEKRKNCTLVKVMPQTGRTHQIRVHFFALNHPLVGDPLYQSKKFKPIPSERLMLHAHKLTFKNLAGEEKTYAAPLPECFL